MFSFRLTTNHKRCNRVTNWISLKTGLEKEIGVTESWEVPEFRELNEGLYRPATSTRVSFQHSPAMAQSS